jgi:hypothetical protein
MRLSVVLEGRYTGYQWSKGEQNSFHCGKITIKWGIFSQSGKKGTGKDTTSYL